MKVDVVIPTKNEANIRQDLMVTLKSAPWVNSIIIEKSKPLSIARVNGAKKCVTPWILNVDDDATIPVNLMDVFEPYMNDPDVLAVSAQAYDVNKHWLAYRRGLYTIWKNHHEIKGNFDNRAYVIRRDFMINYHPPPCFYCEDTALAEEVQKKGKWINLPYCGINHYPKYTSMVYWGYAAAQLNLYKSRTKPIENFIGHLGISYLAFLYTLDPRTLHFNIRQGVQKFTGYLMAVIDGY